MRYRTQINSPQKVNLHSPIRSPGVQNGQNSKRSVPCRFNPPLSVFEIPALWNSIVSNKKTEYKKIQNLKLDKDGEM